MDTRDQRERSNDATGVVDQGKACLGWWSIGFAGQAHPTSQALDYVVVPWIGGTWASCTERRKRAAHDPWIDTFKVGVADTQLGWDVTSEVGIHTVDSFD